MPEFLTSRRSFLKLKVLLPVLHQGLSKINFFQESILVLAKERLKVIKSAVRTKSTPRILFAIRTKSPPAMPHLPQSKVYFFLNFYKPNLKSDWVPGNPKRPYPTDVEMRSGILPQFTAAGFIQSGAEKEKTPPAQLGPDGLAAVMTQSGDGNPVNSIGNTWRNRGSVSDISLDGFKIEQQVINPPSDGFISSSESSDSSIGD